MKNCRLLMMALFTLLAGACSDATSSTSTTGMSANGPGSTTGGTAMDTTGTQTATTSEGTTGVGEPTTGGLPTTGGMPDAGTTGPTTGGDTTGGDTTGVPEGGVADADTGAPEGGTMEEDPEFAACVEALLPKCGYDQPEQACAAQTTPPIPLSDGGTWGNIEVPMGPHGAYVEWNEGEAFRTPEQVLELGCNELTVAASFGEPAEVNADILNLRGAELNLFTIFRPACMKEGETYPVVTWANGTCGQTGGYGVLLAALASHGYVVVASNSRWTNQGNEEMLVALDLAAALNEDSESVYYQKLDLENVGAMGHSQGAAATVAASSDPRVDAIILWNGGATGSDIKPFLTIAGDRDINEPTAEAFASATDAASQPGAWLYYHQVLETGGSATGHLTLMMQPERVIEPTVAWWDYWLKGDQSALDTFVGDDCGLCTSPEQYDYGHNAMLQ